MSSYSPYSVHEAETTKWRPEEDRAASAFVGIAIFLTLEINVEIFRVFKKRQGLYFWAIELGSWACLVDSIGVILKFLASGTQHIWPLYTLMLLTGWSIYAPAQLLVLYSRLHLVVQSRKVQRYCLYAIIASCILTIVPTWIVVWPAYDINGKVTERWSAKDAIVERYTQIGLTIVECIISGIYIKSLLTLMRLKSSVRQRRVFLDLIYVNVITIAFDILTVILVYLNQLGTSHPIQTFSYILKLRMEFVVLNQLMAVAARGLRRETFEERRYHQDSIDDTSNWDRQFQDMTPFGDSSPEKGSAQTSGGEDPSTGSTQISIPAPVLENAASRSKSGQLSSSESMSPLKSPTSNESHEGPKGRGASRFQSILKAVRPLSTQPNGSRKAHSTPFRAKRKRSHPNTYEDDDEDDIPLHMWEHNGEIVMQVPWFRKVSGEGSKV